MPQLQMLDSDKPHGNPPICGEDSIDTENCGDNEAMGSNVASTMYELKMGDSNLTKRTSYKYWI